MKIIPAKYLPELDQVTIKNQGITSDQLMERAVTAITFMIDDDDYYDFIVFAGTGNNGGDGYVLAHLLSIDGLVRLVDCRIGKRSKDNQRNYNRLLREESVDIITLEEGDPYPNIELNETVIDAIFGSGLNRPVEGYWAGLIEHINKSDKGRVLAIDLPSGVLADGPTTGARIEADVTYSLGTLKLSEFAASNSGAYKDKIFLDIGLDRIYIHQMEVVYHAFGMDDARRLLLKKRNTHSHKGTFGHALIVAGSQGKVGAAVLCARATLRAGAGMVTIHLPRCGYEIAQIGFPEAMCEVDRHRFIITEVEHNEKYATIGIGPGIGTNKLTANALTKFLDEVDRPIVLDADALNIMAAQPELLGKVPKGSILTPHPKEFERLFGETSDDFQRWELQLQKAKAYGCIIILKGGYTAVALPEAGNISFNTSGNPGMGTAGTGDVLTGILTGLLAQGYSPESAAQLGVYLHGLAGDIAADELEQESLLASDLITHLGKAFKAIRYDAFDADFADHDDDLFDFFDDDDDDGGGFDSFDNLWDQSLN